MEQFSRTELLIGSEGVKILQKKHVAVFGVGGVGGYVIEALARAGVGHLDIIDKDVVSESNINRQIIALHSTIGQSKVSVMAKRLKDINPQICVCCHECFFLPDNADQFDFSRYDYIVDAVDTVTAKLELVMRAQAVGTPIVASMGTGNKLNPSQFEIADISKTSVCPLAKVMRRELREKGVKHLKVLYSKEEPVVKQNPPGSISFVPSVAGLMIAGEVIRDLLEDTLKNTD